MSVADEERIGKIYRQYVETVLPLVVNYEVLACQFPIAILNEIRALFTHLSRVHVLRMNGQKVSENIRGAERHLQRIQLDCFKYTCIAYVDKINEFIKLYEGVNLAYVDNGNFLPLFLSKKSESTSLLRSAKESEIAKEDDRKLYYLYQKAMETYATCYKMISGDNIVKFDNLKVLRDRKEKHHFWFNIAGMVFGVMGLIGTAFTIYGFYR